MMTSNSGSDRLDKAGATASLLCAIHCAAMPLIITLLPFIGLSFLAHESTEWALLFASAAIGVTSLCWGYREHRSNRALAVLSLGLTLLFCDRVLEENGIGWGAAAMVLGGCTVAASHLVNRALCRMCRTCDASHSHNLTEDDCEDAGGRA